jgi:amino-acid N-acetyltransferase
VGDRISIELAAGRLDAVRQLLNTSRLPPDGLDASNCEVWVAEVNGRIVGSAALERYDLDRLLRSVAVEEEARGQSIGRTLVDHAIAVARKSGARAIYLLTTTAEEYFPSFGFRRVAREEVPSTIRASREFRDLCPASAVVMVLSLEDGMND